MLSGKIHICVVHSSHDDDYVAIKVDDDISCRPAIEIRMSIADFGEALLGRGRTPCHFEPSNPCVGKKREHKTVIVPLRHGADATEIAEAFAPFEIDGWKGSVGHAKNHHNRTRTEDGRESVKVMFERYV